MVISSKPTILLIPGAFARPTCFDRLIPRLESQGYETSICTLPSSDPQKPEECSCAGDADYIREAHLLPLIEHESKNVVMFAHSYGAECGGVAVEGLARKARFAQGKPGGVLGLIYLAGTMVPKGVSLQELATPNQWPPVFKIDRPRKGCAVIEPVIDVLYTDADPQDHAALEAGMTPHAVSAFTSKSPLPGANNSAFDTRRVYIRTAQDCCQLPQFQDMYMQKSGVEWIVEHIDASHGAFFTKPDLVAKIVMANAEKWAF